MCIRDRIEQGHEVAPGTIEAVTGALDAEESPAEILDDVVWRHRNTKVSPKTLNQKRYVDSIRDHTITFGIGPAGTGKTFLAVAMAAAALAERQVQRIIPVSYTHLRAHETVLDLVCRLLLEK